MHFFRIGVLALAFSSPPALAIEPFVIKDIRVEGIQLTGLREFDKETVLKAFNSIGLAEGRIFDKSLLDRAEQELKRQYLTRGRYAANVNTTVTPLERNRVSLNFAVEEGDAAKIRQVSIIGNQAF